MPHIKALDGIRGLAIGLVLFWHYAGYFVIAKTWPDWPNLRWYYYYTWFGVDLFFTLSGFLIAGILLDHEMNRETLKAFFVRRAFRILPLYGVMLLILVLAVYILNPLSPSSFPPQIFNTSIPIWSYFLFLQNFSMAYFNRWGSPWLDVTWSLAVEEHFYLIMPFLLFFLGRKMALVAVVLLSICAVLSRFYITGIDGYVMTFTRADSIGIGVICAFLVRSRYWIPVKRYYIHVLVCAASWYFAWKIQISRPIDDDWNHLLFAVMFGSLVLVTYSKQIVPVNWILESRILTWLGLHCYGLYLFHKPVRDYVHIVLAQSFPKNEPVGLEVVSALLALAVTAGLAALSMTYFEGPLMRMGKRFAYSRRARAPVGEPALALA